MRGQPENRQDFGLGKKVEPKKVEKDPWVKGGRTGVYRNTETGKTETRIPANDEANGYWPNCNNPGAPIFPDLDEDNV